MSEKEYWKQRWVVGTNEPNNFATRAYACMRKKKYQTLLDVGCGDGRDAVYLLYHKYRSSFIEAIAAK